MTYLFYDERDHTYDAIDFDHRISTSWVSLTKLKKAGYSIGGTYCKTPTEFLNKAASFHLIGTIDKYQPTYQDWLDAYPEIFI